MSLDLLDLRSKGISFHVILCVKIFNEAEASSKYVAALTFHLSGHMTFASFFSAH